MDRILCTNPKVVRLVWEDGRATIGGRAEMAPQYENAAEAIRAQGDDSSLMA